MNTPAPAARWGVNWAAVFGAFISLVGLAVFMYPPTAAWWSQYHQSKAIVGYSAVTKADPPPGNSHKLMLAHQYNDALKEGELLIGADANKPVVSGETQGEALRYEDMLASPSGLMARLKIPSIGVDLPVYHGTDDETLRHGVGHLEGTSLPVGGPDTHSVLTAHRGLATATLFNDLDQLKAGDTFTIEVAGDVLTYRVFETHVVDPSDTKVINARAGMDLATLVTCTPLGINTHRILVTGERIHPTPIAEIEALGEPPEIPGFPWWAVVLPGGVVVAAVFVWWSGKPRQDHRVSATR